MPQASSAKARTRVIVADDDPIARQAIQARLEASGTAEAVAEAQDGAEALAAVRSKSPDVLLLDVLMPAMAGLEVLRDLANLQPAPRTILLTSRLSAKQKVEALKLGARGFVFKHELEQLSEAIAVVMQGEYWVEGERVSNVLRVLAQLEEQAGGAAPSPSRFGLTERELQVVAAVADGCSNREIASNLKISEETVKRHLTHIFDKVGMSNRLELALFALNQRLVPESR
jgi:DNA-binding NarL/FixJ family response regulator